MQTNVQIDSRALHDSPRRHVKRGARINYTKELTLEELIVATPSERNWRGICIALLVIVVVLALIVLSIILVSPHDVGSRFHGIRPTLEDVLELETLSNRRFNETWISESELVYRDQYGGVSVMNIENMTTRVLMTNSSFRQLNAVDFKVSSDLRYVLLISDVERVYTRSRRACYHVYETATRSKFPLSPTDGDTVAPHLHYATFSPDGRALVFVHDNDLYYKPRVHKSPVVRLTTSASDYNKPNKAPVVLNGVLDWLYEHEVMSVHAEAEAVWFAPNSRYIVYLETNNSDVGVYKYPWYGGLLNGYRELRYPQVREVNYPKVGTANPNVTVWVVDLTTDRPRARALRDFSTKTANFSSSTSSSDDTMDTSKYYLIAAKWYGTAGVAVVWLNREQNQSLTFTCRVPSMNCTLSHIEVPEGGEWVQLSKEYHGPLFNRAGDSVHLLPVRDGEHGYFLHVCYVDSKSRRVTPLTQGPFEVTDILAWDEENRYIYFLGTTEDRADERHLYRVGDVNNSDALECLTCTSYAYQNETVRVENASVFVHHLSSSNHTAEHCLYNRARFSPDYRYYVQQCLGPAVPFTALYDAGTGVRLATLDANAFLRDKLELFAKPEVHTLEVPLQEYFKAKVKLYLPPSTKIYDDAALPLVLIVDAEPDTQAVSKKWSVDLAWYLSVNRSFVVAQVDARGTGFQGQRFRLEVQHRLGSVDVQDQLTVLSYLRSKFNCISMTKICVLGMPGYGAYSALTMLTMDDGNIINCTIALSPITNWKFYNTFFTERYLGFAHAEYNHASLVTEQRAVALAERRVLLIHGTADDVVHVQHSMALIAMLIKYDAIFTHLMYPDVNHMYDNVKMHLIRQIDTFLDDTFQTDLSSLYDQLYMMNDPALDFITSFSSDDKFK